MGVAIVEMKAAQPPPFRWATGGGSTNSDRGNAIALDGLGNSYVAGVYTGNASFGPTNLTGNQAANMFLAKYNFSGSLLWIVRANGASESWYVSAAGVALAPGGGAYVTGRFGGVANFGSLSVTGNLAGENFFLARYSNDGNLLWVRHASSSVISFSGYALASDGSGNAYVAGSFGGIADFGSISFTNRGANDVFVAKYDPAGTRLWVKQGGGEGDDHGLGVAVDSTGNAFVTGPFSSINVVFDAVTVTNPSNSTSVFLAKYDGSGNLIWAKNAVRPTTIGSNYGLGVGADSIGNCAVVGTFSRTATFDGTNLFNSTSADIFVAKYGPSGNLLWVRQAGSTDYDTGNAVAFDPAGNLYITGDVQGSASFGSTNLTVTGAGAADLYIAKYSSSGNLLRVIQAGGGASAVVTGNGIAVDAAGTTYVTGEFSQAADFGVTNLVSAGGDVFVSAFGGAPFITLQPRTQWSDPGGNITFAISAKGTMPLSYQWRFNGTNLPAGGPFSGVNSESLTISNVQLANAGAFSVVVTNSEGSLTSSNAILSIPFGNPIALVNGEYSPSNRFVILGANSVAIDLETSFPGGSIAYTLDGSDPRLSIDQSAPVSFTLPRNSNTNVNVTLRVLAYTADYSDEVEADPVLLTFIPTWTLEVTNTGGGGWFSFTTPIGAQVDTNGGRIQIVATNGSQVTLGTLANVGWSFLHWTNGAGGSDPLLTLTLDRDLSVQGVFGTLLTTSVNTNGWIERQPDVPYYAYNAVVRLTALPTNSNWFFRFWVNDAANQFNSPLDFRVTNANPNAGARFAQLPAGNFALNVTVDGDGAVTRSPQQSNYASGASVTLTAVPDAGRMFTGWSGDANGLGTNLSVVMDSNKIVTANFTLPPTVVLTMPTNGQVLSSPDFLATAVAGDSDGFVTRVEFFANGNLLGTLTNSPFSLTMSNQRPGALALLVRATDNAGAVMTTTTLVTVSYPPITFAPSSGPVGGSVVISGVNFHPTPSSNIVFFGSVRAVVTASSKTSITATVPAGAIYAPITVTANGLTASANLSFGTTFSGQRTIDTAAFAPPLNFAAPVGRLGGWVRLADLNGDGKPDLMVRPFNLGGDPLFVFSNTSSSGVVSDQSFAAPFSATSIDAGFGVGDLNADGRLDLIAESATHTNVLVLENSITNGVLAPGVFGSPVSYPAGDQAPYPAGFAVRDMDNDGFPDLITGYLQIFRNSGAAGHISAASFAPPVQLPVYLNSDPAVGDLDGDGRPEVVTFDPTLTPSSILVFRNVSSIGSLTTNSFAEPVQIKPVQINMGTDRLAHAILADLNQDGRLDIIAANYDRASISVYQNVANPGTLDTNSFNPEVQFQTGIHPRHIVVGDVNGDGKPDIVVVNESDQTVSVFQNIITNGIINTSAFASKVDFVVSNGPLAVALGDLDGDGRPEIVTSNYGDGTVSVLRNLLGGTNAPPSVDLVTPASNSVFSAPANILISASATDSDGTVANVKFYDGAALLGTVTNAPFNFTWTNAPVGSHSLTAVATDNGGLSATSSPSVNITVTEPQAEPLFSLSAAAYSVAENVPNGVLQITVLKSPNSKGGSVTVQTRDGLARAVPLGGGEGDYLAVSNVLNFGAGVTSKSVIITLVNDNLSEGNHDFTVFLSNPTAGVLVNPTNATITIIDDDVPSVTDSLLAFHLPDALTPDRGLLRVLLQGAEATGRWRFPWDLRWRTNGELVTSMVPGNYPIEFKGASGFFSPAETVVAVVANTITTNVSTYISDGGVPRLGALQLNLQPTNTIGALARWRFLGESTQFQSGQVVSNLSEGVYAVEFDVVNGWVTPTPMAVTVFADQIAARDVPYLVEELVAAPEPVVLTFNEIHESTNAAINLPWWFNGQLQTDAGFSSGFVVKERVVLTAAHAVFNDATLTYVTDARWFFQRQRGDYEAPPQTPRGWYVFDNYSSLRSNDMPGFSSTASRNRDVAALYFVEDPAGPNRPGRGGYGGFLVSNAATNEWLTNVSLKTLAGYPMKTNQSRMHGATPNNYQFTKLPDQPQVYATPSVFSRPGNSGGPLCVKHPNNSYYPAAVYLGGAGQSLVRAIDSEVVDLINRAEVSGNGGGNNTSGGVITFLAGAGVNASHPAYVQVLLTPAAAVRAGAAWRLQGDVNYSILSNSTRAVISTNAALDFQPIDGWNAPTNRTVQVSAGALSIINGFYTVLPPGLVVDRTRGIGITGTIDTTFVIEFRTNLTTAQWQPLKTNTLSNGFNVLLPPPGTNGRSEIYRARWLP